MTIRITTRFAVVVVALVALTGCAPMTSTDASPPAESGLAGDSVTITDAWVKSAETGMSAAFGELENSSDKDAIVVSVASTASQRPELHETVMNDSGEMVMRPKDGGFVIPAGGTFLLEPGANHIMLMDLTQPLTAGQETEFTLTFADGSAYTFTAPAKDYSGANENYEGGTDMDMGTDN